MSSAGGPPGGRGAWDGEVPDLHAHWMLPADLGAVATGRHLVADTLAAWGLDALIADAQLVVSELITNAVGHAGSPAAIDLSFRRGVLRIGVQDRSDGSVVLREPTAAGGWGLRLVAALSRSWGEEHLTSGGKEVWCTLDLDRPVEVPPIR